MASCGTYADPPRYQTSERNHRPHRDDSVDSIEEIHRDFPPGEGGYARRGTPFYDGSRRRARSAGRDRLYDDDYVGLRGSDLPSNRRYRGAPVYDDGCEYPIIYRPFLLTTTLCTFRWALAPPLLFHQPRARGTPTEEPRRALPSGYRA
jgi:hypothetical protein